MVDISDVFIIEGGQVSVEGFAFAPFFFFFFFFFWLIWKLCPCIENIGPCERGGRMKSSGDQGGKGLTRLLKGLESLHSTMERKARASGTGA